jgi:RNA polymerase sigma-70 factor (ECF subfamily)
LTRDERHDNLLIERAQKGDPTSFGALAEAHRSLLERYLSRHLPSQSVEDALQETFAAAWASIDTLKEAEMFVPWILGIARNRSADVHRKVEREKRGIQAWLERWRIQEEHSLAIDRHTTMAVKERVRELPVPQREVLELYYYSGLNLPDIADLLGRNLNTVKYQFFRAHQVVAESLDVSEMDGLKGERS